MLVAWHECYNHPVPENHKFPMEKYDLVKDQLLLHGIIELKNIIKPNILDLKHAFAIHDKEYIKALVNLELSARAQRESGFEHNQKLIERELIITEGTRYITEMVLTSKSSYAFNIAGGTHHAFKAKPEGFCLINDFAVAAVWALNEKHINNALILDLDVHQGNGTAEILANYNQLFTISIHGKNNYPFRKEKSDIDIELIDNIGDSDYLKTLSVVLNKIPFIPDIIFYQAGVDILASDKLGRLGVTIEGVKQRDELVFNYASSINSKIVTTLGGGYSPNINDIITCHCNTFQTAKDVFE